MYTLMSVLNGAENEELLTDQLVENWRVHLAFIANNGARLNTEKDAKLVRSFVLALASKIEKNDAHSALFLRVLVGELSAFEDHSGMNSRNLSLPFNYLQTILLGFRRLPETEILKRQVKLSFFRSLIYSKVLAST
jgi:hypothetical protein